MSLVSERFHENKLKKYHINIKTTYIVGNKILEKNTDGINDDIKKGIQCEKKYYIDNKLKHTEKIFDSRIEYTYLSNEEEKDYSCSNCGMNSKLKNFSDGCPYCKTYYNIDYKDKDLGSKYYYDRVLRNPKYKLVTAVIDFIISLILSFLFIKFTSRTFNSYDITKVLLYGIILFLILYYFFYIIDAYIILTPIKNYKDKQNQKQIDFWNRTALDKKTFFNNLNYELSKKYYRDNNVIDYDILDYLEFQEFYKNNKLYVKVKIEMRIVYYENKKIVSKYITDTCIMKRHEDGVLKIKNNEYIIKCHNCGASIDITKGYCEYCKSEIKYLQEWIMENN